jgi:hypothetical protein
VASQYNIIYPDTAGDVRISLDGGLNTKFDRQWIDDNQSPDCLNVIFGQNSVETRGGTDLLNTAPVGSFICDGLYTRHDSSGSETMVAWFDGTLYDLQGTSFISVTSAKCIFTAGVRVFSAEYEDYIFFTNGSNPMYKYNGSEFTRGSVPAPTETSTAGTAPTGTNLSGSYSYKVTYVNSNLVESDVGPVSNTFTAASEDIRVTSIPVAPQSFGVNSRRLYRTEDGGTTYKRVATISDNTTTTYDDAVEDGSLGVDAPADQGEIPTTATQLLYHQSRIFFIDEADNFVKYTEIGNPYVAKSESFRRIGDGSGDIPKTLGIFDNSVVVNCADNSTWIIYMPNTDDSNWVDLRVKTEYGSLSPFGLFTYNNRLMFPAIKDTKFVGFAAISGQTVEPTVTLLTVSSAGSDLKSNVIEPDMFTVVENQLPNLSSIVFQNKAYITLTYSAGSENNRIYLFDFSYENLSKRQEFAWAPWSGLSASQFTIYDGKLYYGCADDCGNVFQMNTSTYNDNGSAINSYYWTKEFGGRPQDANLGKDFRWLHLLYELSGDYYMNVTSRTDSKGGVGSTEQLTLDPGGTLWGALRWGIDEWSPGGEQQETKFSIGDLGTAKRVQFKFDNQNTVNQKFKMIGMNLEYNIRGRR